MRYMVALILVALILVVSFVYGCDEAEEGTAAAEQATEATAGPAAESAPEPSPAPGADEAAPAEGTFGPSAGTRSMELAAGQWTRHRMTSSDGASSELWYAIVGEEDGVFVVEVENQTPLGPMNMQLRLAIEGESRAPSAVDVRSMRMRTPGGEVREMPVSRLRTQQEAFDNWSEILSAEWADGETEDVTVPAGTFRGAIRHERDISFGPVREQGDIWRHSAVPISGMIKSRSEEGDTVELLAFGTSGAESRFPTE